MRLVAYIFSFIAFFTFSTGILFKIQHWPGATVFLIGGYSWSAIAGLMVLIHKLKEKKSDNNLEILDSHE